MSGFILHNGDLRNDGEALFGTRNRAFRYGDALFESIRIVEGRTCFFSDHYERLGNSMQFLEMKWNMTSDELLGLLNILIGKNNISKGGRLRLQVFRKEGGLYTPSTNEVGWVAEAEPIADNYFPFSQEGLHIDLYPEIKVPAYRLSSLKSANSLLYIKAGLYRKKHRLDECLLLNEAGYLVEGSAHNVFLVMDDILYTPSVKQGCLNGVMRKQVVKLARHYGMEVKEGALDPALLFRASEVFFTNAVGGIKWAKSYKSKRYFNKVSRRLNELLNKQLLSCLMDFQES